MDAYYVLLGFLVVLGVGSYAIAEALGRPRPEASENDADPADPGRRAGAVPAAAAARAARSGDEGMREQLEAAGYRVGTAEESALLDIKLALRRELKALGWTPSELAHRAGSSQSRVAKVEGDEQLPTLDQLVRLLLLAGESAEDIGRLVADSHEPATERVM